MKASKFTLEIEVEALSTDCFAGMLIDVIAQIDSENVQGLLVADDGDTVKWSIKNKPVEF